MPTRPVPPAADRISIVRTIDLVRFPATKDALRQEAARHGAYETVLMALAELPDGTYASAREVADALAAPAAPADGDRGRATSASA